MVLHPSQKGLHRMQGDGVRRAHREVFSMGEHVARTPQLARQVLGRYRGCTTWMRRWLGLCCIFDFPKFYAILDFALFFQFAQWRAVRRKAITNCKLLEYVKVSCSVERGQGKARADRSPLSKLPIPIPIELQFALVFSLASLHCTEQTAHMYSNRLAVCSCFSPDRSQLSKPPIPIPIDMQFALAFCLTSLY